MGNFLRKSCESQFMLFDELFLIFFIENGVQNLYYG